MPENQNQQNMSELLEMIRQSYGNEDADAEKIREESKAEIMTDEELKERLREQFLKDGLPDVLKSVDASDTYAYRRGFFG